MRTQGIRVAAVVCSVRRRGSVSLDRQRSWCPCLDSAPAVVALTSEHLE